MRYNEDNAHSGLGPAPGAGEASVTVDIRIVTCGRTQG